MNALFLNTRPQAYPPYELGADIAVVHLPLLDIVPTNHSVNHQWVKLKNGQYGAVVFISPMAVQFFVQKLSNSELAQWQQLATPMIAVGQATKQALADNSITAISPPANHENNEGMLALPVIQTLIAKPNQAVLIVKGVGGRTVLSDFLQNKGVAVEELILYQRTAPNGLADELGKFFMNFDKSLPLFVLISSGQSFDNLLNALQKNTKTIKDFNATFLCLGERLTVLVGQMGGRTVTIDDLKPTTLKNCIDNFLL